MEQWWNDTDEGKPKCLQRNLSQCLSAHHKFYINWIGNEAGPPLLTADNQPVKRGRAYLFEVYLTML
jgi:hypothetical protein